MKAIALFPCLNLSISLTRGWSCEQVNVRIGKYNPYAFIVKTIGVLPLPKLVSAHAPKDWLLPCPHTCSSMRTAVTEIPVALQAIIVVH